MANLEELKSAHVYAEDQRPCLVAFDKCGCPKAVCTLADAEMVKTAAEFIDECDWADKFGVLPLSFIRSGALSFDCKHTPSEAHDDR